MYEIKTRCFERRRRVVSVSCSEGHGTFFCCQYAPNLFIRNPAGVSGFFIDIKSFRSRYGPRVDSASNRNECQKHFLGVKTAGAYGCQPYHHPGQLPRNLGTLTSWNPLGHSYKSEGRWFDPSWCHCNFSLT